MLLPGAVKEFESLFKSVSARAAQQLDKELPVTWSGGQRRFDDTSAALYASQDLAITAWLDTARSYANVFNFHELNEGDEPSIQKKAVLEWVVKPELHEFQITIADKRGQHRLVNNRFAVKSQFVVKEAG